jgi:hypothetical protein
MAHDGRHRSRSSRRRGVAAVAVAAAFALLAPVPPAGGDPEPDAAAAARLGRGIEGLTFDAGGRLYAADLRNDRVVVLGRGGEVLSEVGGGLLDEPTGVAVAPDGDVFVTDEDGVQRFSAAGARLAAWPADAPAGVALAGDGTVLVSERDRVARFTTSGAPLAQFAVDGPHGIAVAADGSIWVAGDDGLEHFDDRGAPLRTTPADHTYGVAVMPDGTVLIAERERNRVARIAPGGARAGALEGHFDKPRAVAVDCRGNIAVADDSAERIHRIAAQAAPPPPCVAAITGGPAAVPPLLEPERPVARRLTVPPAPAPAVVPVLGRQALTASAVGRVLVRAPGTRTPAVLREGSLVPMGARFDARAGQVRLTFASRTADFDRLGTSQTGVFDSGIFSIHQPAGASLVELRLVGAPPSCRLSVSGRAVGPRHLWSDVRGSFRTRGALATVTARDARWLTEDRCDGTLVVVTRGSVAVRDRRRGRTVRVRAGGRLLVRPARRP